MKEILETNDWKLHVFIEWKAKQKLVDCKHCIGAGKIGGGFKDIDDAQICPLCNGTGKKTVWPTDNAPAVPPKLREHMRQAWLRYLEINNDADEESAIRKERGVIHESLTYSLQQHLSELATKSKSSLASEMSKALIVGFSDLELRSLYESSESLIDELFSKTTKWADPRGCDLVEFKIDIREMVRIRLAAREHKIKEKDLIFYCIVHGVDLAQNG